MTVVHCPKCDSDYDPGNDELNDLPAGVSTKVVCPACGQWLRLPEQDLIPPPDAPREILDEMRKQSQLIKRGSAASSDGRPRKRHPDREDEDRPRQRRRRDDEEDEDRPRQKSRGDDAEDEDRPRKKRRGRDDDEENEDEDRPRQRRGRDDHDEEDEDRPRHQRRGRDEDDEADEDRPRKKRRRDEDEVDEDRPRRRRRDDDDEDDEDRSRKRRRDHDDDDDDDRREREDSPKLQREQLATVRGGMTCYEWRWILLAAIGAIGILNMLLLLVGVLLSSLEALQAVGVIVQVLNVGTALFALAQAALGIVGAALFMRMPRKSQLRGLIVANLILECVPNVLMITAIFFAVLGALRFSRDMSATSGLILLLTLVTAVAGFIVFMLSLRAIAKYVKHKSAGPEAILMLIVTLIYPFAAGLFYGVVLWSAYASRNIYVMGIGLYGALMAISGAWIYIALRIRNLIVMIRRKVKAKAVNTE